MDSRRSISGGELSLASLINSEGDTSNQSHTCTNVELAISLTFSPSIRDKVDGLISPISSATSLNPLSPRLAFTSLAKRAKSIWLDIFVPFPHFIKDTNVSQKAQCNI